VALFVDQLHALPQRHLHGVVEPGKAVRPDEFVFLQHTGDLLRNDAAGLVLALRLEWRCRYPESVVLDLFCRFRSGLFTGAAAAAEQPFEKGHVTPPFAARRRRSCEMPCQPASPVTIAAFADAAATFNRRAAAPI